MIINVIMGTFFLVLSAVLFYFSRVYAELPTYVSMAEDIVMSFSAPDNETEAVDKDSLYSAEDYIGFTLYRTPNGKKWHLSKECKYLQNSKKIIVTDYLEAVADGLSACTDCGYPDKHPD